MTRRPLILAAVCLVAGCGSAARSDGEAADRPGRRHALPPWRTGVPGLLVNVPEAYEKGLRAGEGFMVHLFRRPPETAPADSATLAVYVGRHPREPRTRTLAEPGRIAGREVTWFGGAWPDERGRQMYHAEAYVRGLFAWPRCWQPAAQGLVVHVMAWGTDQREVERLMAAAESLRLAP
jgi:hypothetical protein